MKEYKFHPLCELFPVMSNEELATLAEDISANGQQNPILLFDGKIIDGRNRYLACKLAGKNPKVEVLKAKNLNAIVCSLNIHRRHLTDAQRAMLAAEIANLNQGEKRADGSIDLSEAAKAVNVSEPSAKRAKAIKEKGG